MFEANIIFPDDHIERLADAYASGNLRGHLILAGPPGVGKSTIARHIISSSLKHDDSKEHISVLNGGDWNASSLNYCLQGFNFLRSICGEPFPYVLIDEIDLVPESGKHALRAAMDRADGHCGFIFTTNHLHSVNAAFQSRCEIVEFEKASVSQLIAIAQTILNNTDLELTSDQLELLAKSCDGDIRMLQRTMQQVIAQQEAA